MDKFIGPVFPPNCPEEKAESSQTSDAYGPTLPPHLKNSQEERVVGPALPPHLMPSLHDSSSDSEEMIGPTLPEGNSQEDGTDLMRRDIQRRAWKMKQKLSGKPDSAMVEREEWMTVLPPEMSKQFGLGPRSFQRSSTQKVSDRSGWTETPSTSAQVAQQNEEKAKKKSDEERVKRKMREKYDEEMSKMAHKHHKKSKRKESLYDMHKKERKRKKDKDPDKGARVPFDREKDLKLNIMDSAKRASLIKNSKLLNSNFAHGEGKYL